MERTALIVACLLLTVSLAPAAGASATTSGPELVLDVRAVSDGSDTSLTTTIGRQTFRPDATVTFRIVLRNVGDQAAEVTLGDPPYRFTVRDVFGAPVTNGTVESSADAGQQLTVEAGSTARVAEIAWEPREQFDAWDGVVVYDRAEASVALDDRRLTAELPFKVEQEGLLVDAYGQFPGAEMPVFEGMDAPVTLRNLADRELAGRFSFTVRDSGGSVFTAEARQVTLGPSGGGSDTVQGTWDLRSDAGNLVGSGTYLIDARLRTDNGTHRDAFPVEVHAGPQIQPVPTVRTDRTHHAPGDTVNLTLTLGNPTSEPMTLEFPTGQRFDFVMTLPDGSKQRWSEGKAFTQEVSRRTLAGGETINWTAEMSLPGNQTGIAEVVGIVTTREPIRSLPHPFVIGPFDPREPFRTCKGGTSTQLSISLTDASGASHGVFAPGQAVHVHLVNTGEDVYEDGASVQIQRRSGEVLFEDEMPADKRLHPGRAWTFVWDQTDASGRQVANGSYVAVVAAEGGRVGMELDVGPTAGRSGSSSGTIAGTECSYETTSYYQTLDVSTDKHRYAPGEPVTVRYGADQPLKGLVELTILDGRRRVVHETSARLNTTLAAGERATFTWEQRTDAGEPAGTGFYVVRVEVSGLSGETPLLVGDGPGLVQPEAGYEVVRPDPRAGMPAWDEGSLRSAADAYGQTYARWFTKLADQRQRLLEEAARRGLHGAFSYDGEVVEGRHVTFRFDEADGRIHAYSVAPGAESPVTVFPTITTRPYHGLESGATAKGLSLPNPAIVGPTFVHRGQSAQIVVHDRPRAQLMVQAAEPRTVDLTLADAFSARADSTDRNCAAVVGPVNATICVMGGGEIRVADSVVSVEMDAGSQLMVFGRSPERSDLLLEQGISEGRVGAEVAIAGPDSSQPFIYTPGFRQITTDPVRRDGETVGVEVLVDKADPAGTVLVFDLDPAMLEAADPREVVVQLDGETLPRASSLSSVLSPTDDEPKYVVVLAEDNVQVAVQVDHFSERTITIQSLAEAVQDPLIRMRILQSALVAGVVTLAAAAAAFRRSED